MVEEGAEAGKRIEIKSGLQTGELAVITGAYLLNSEYIFKKRNKPNGRHTHVNAKIFF